MPDSSDLGPQLEAFIAGLVESGRYASRSAVLRDGVRLIQDQETRLAALDDALARGIADADAGRVHSLDDVFDRLQARYEVKS